MVPQSSTRPAKQTVQRSSLRTSLFLETLALLSITVVIISAAAFALSQNELKGRVRSQLQSIAQEKAAFLETTISRQREQLSILGHDSTNRSIESLTQLVGFKVLLRLTEEHAVETLAGNNSNVSVEFLKTLAATEGTIFRPIVTENGWTQYVIATPMVANEKRTGTLVAVFDATNLASRILHAEYVGKTAEILLSASTKDDQTVLRFDEVSAKAVPILDPANRNPVTAALVGDEGVITAKDYAGITVLEAYRAVPTLGWAVIAKIDRYEVMAPVALLAFEIAGMGLVVVLFLSLSAFVLARRISGPLEELTQKLNGLESRHWRFVKTITTGNELEAVDTAADDLTRRLRAAHEHLEEIVRKRTEELRKEHAEDQAVLQSMDDGLIVTNDAGIVTYMNPTALKLTEHEDAIGKPATEILNILTKEGEPVTKSDHPVEIILRSKTRYAPRPDPQFTLLSASGKETPLQIRATPILRGQKSYGAVLVIRDIAEERRIDHMKSEFISLVSHQLRTPLSSMRWYLEMLIAEDAGPLTPDQKDYVGQVSTSNARMVHLVNALLNVSRIELGRFEMSPETINVHEVLKTVLASFELELKEKSLNVKLEVPDESIGTRSDKGLLILILENLMSNAIKYSTSRGTITVTVEPDEKTKKAMISVHDTGIGIPIAQQKDIGRKLFRATNAKTTDTDGNGLGLYISHIAAENIGATLDFVSSEKKGSTFSLSIPLNVSTQ